MLSAVGEKLPSHPQTNGAKPISLFEEQGNCRRQIKS